MEFRQAAQQLGDFIKGRLLFVEDYARRKGQDPPQILAEVRRQALDLAGEDEEKRTLLEEKVFSGVILSSGHLPDWVDKVLLKAMTIVLKGPGAPLYTTTSRHPCITFEAGRFNAHRQADTVFKAFFSGKTPDSWLKNTFLSIYRQCYGDKAADQFEVREPGPGHVQVVVDNSGLEKTDRMDCSTGVGYLYGALEKLGAKSPLVTHERCGAAPDRKGQPCIFEVTWDAAGE